MFEWLSRRMVERGIIKEEEQEIYQFGIWNGFIILLNIFTAFLIGLFTGKLWMVCVFTVFFMTLRSYTGGYHSDSRVFCYVGSNLVLFIPIYTVELFARMPDMVRMVVLGISVGIILIYSPMHSKKRKLDEKEQRHFGRKARIITAVQLMIFGVLYYLELTGYAYAIYASFCIIALLMLIGKIQLLLQFHMEKYSPF